MATTYVVPKYDPTTQAGTLSFAAKQAGVTLPDLLAANPQYQANPNLVREGAVLNIPTPAVPVAPVNPTTPPPTTTALDPAKQALAKNAGIAGLSLSDLEKSLGYSTGLTQEELDKIRGDLGIPDLEKDVFKAAPSTVKLYQDAYDNTGLAAVKQKIDAAQAVIKQREDQLNERLLKVDENPWLSEASRAKSVTREKDFFERSVANETNTVKTLTDLYNSGVKEINDLVTRQTTDFSNQQNINSAKLTWLQKQAEAKATTLKEGKTSQVSSYLSDYLAGKNQGNEPKTIGSAETGYFRWDAQKGKFIQVTAGSGTKGTEAEALQSDVKDMGAQLATVADTTGYVTPANYAKARKAWVEKSGRPAKTFDETFAPYRDPKQTYVTTDTQI